LFLTKYFSEDQIKENEMGEAYAIYEREEKCREGLSEKI
jgi:hypothetical protein